MKIFFTLTIATLLVACTEFKQATINVDDSNEITSISFSIPPLEFDNEDTCTKVTISREDSKTLFLWDVTDTVGIFPEEGCQLYFSMKDGVGTSSVNFDGGGWSMKKDADYYSYLPFVADYYIDKTKIPITFLGQKQTGNATETAGNIGKYYYAAAKGVLSSDAKSISFVYQKLALLHRIIIPVIEGTYKSLTLNAGSNCIAYEGTFNGVDIDQQINDAKYTDELTIELEDVTFTSSGNLYVYMVTPPFKNLGQQITYEVTRSDDTVLLASTPGKNYNPGAAGQMPNLAVYPQTAIISGNGGSSIIKIIANRTTSVTLSTDTNEWLKLDQPTGTSISTDDISYITVTAEKNEGGKRTGHITVSETVNGVELKNVINVTQYPDGFNVAITGWNDSDVDYGGVAQPS